MMKKTNNDEMSVLETNFIKRLPKILIVEDDKGVNRLIRAHLQREGFKTDQAFDGATTTIDKVDKDSSVDHAVGFYATGYEW